MSEPSRWKPMVWRIFWDLFRKSETASFLKCIPFIRKLILVFLGILHWYTSWCCHPFRKVRKHFPVRHCQPKTYCSTRHWKCLKIQIRKRSALFDYIPLVPGRFTGITVWSVKKTSLQGLLSWNIWRECNTLPCLKIKRCGINHSEFLHSWAI